MPKLLKFSCQNCGSRLAVPVSMAGMTDHCPKCNSFVTAPAVKPKAPPEPMTGVAPVQPQLPPQATDKKTEGWSAEELKDAFDPARSPLAKALARKSAEVEAEQTPQQQPTPSVKKPESAPAPAPTPAPTQVHAPQYESLLELPLQDKQEIAGTSDPLQAEPVADQNQNLILSSKDSQDKQPGHAEPVEEKSHAAVSAPVEPPKPDAATAWESEPAFNDERYIRETEAENQPPQSILSSMLKASLNKPRKGISTGMSTGSTSAPAAGASSGVDFTESKAPSSRLPDLHEPVSGVSGSSSREEAGDDNNLDETDPEQPMPGMGEVLAAVNAAGANRDGQPWLTAPFLTVTESSKQEKRQKKRRYLWMGLMAFVAIDLALLAFVFKKPLVQWWHGSREVNAEAADLPAAVFTHQPNGNNTATGQKGTSLTLPAAPAEAESKTEPEPEQKNAVPAAIPVKENPQASTESTPATPAAADKQPAEANAAQTPTAPAADEIILQTPEEVEKELAAQPAASSASAAMPPPPGELAALPLPGTGDDPAAMPAEVSLGKLEPAAPAAPVQRTIGRTSPEAKTALDALLNFLDAKDWKERAKFSQNAKTLQSAMEKHARQYGDGPIRVGSVDFVDRHTPAGSPPYCMFELNGGDLPHRVLALVEQPKSGSAMVDWDGFMEFRHDYLLRFLETDTLPPQKFRVMLRRKHYFDKDVPDLSLKDTFQINQPNAVYDGHVFVPKSTALSRQLANQLGWDKDMPVIVELVWRTNGNKKWVEIQSIPKYGWRG